ncbi:hypothetical protein K3495_g13355 [Podosphaera aphanis]|nr:hypothetical protein K3495_g13355 [Podosphaera aphanis]
MSLSLFPRSFITNDQTAFSPIVRLLDELDQYSHNSDNSLRSNLKSFTPKFDVKELKDSYELHGELPGIEQKDVEIEFSDASTITIKGHTERTYTQGTPPAKCAEGRSEESNSCPAEKSENEKSGETCCKKLAEEKIWVKERSIGEFSRSFSFPASVDQDNVKASMKNGILSVIIPKQKKHQGRKITIQ